MSSHASVIRYLLQLVSQQKCLCFCFQQTRYIPYSSHSSGFTDRKTYTENLRLRCDISFFNEITEVHKQ
jgi:hypothetical protein